MYVDSHAHLEGSKFDADREAVLSRGRELIEADVAFAILQHARERAEHAKLQVKFFQSDASKIPLVDGAVDGVFCNRLLHHILQPNEREMFLREFHRVTRRSPSSWRWTRSW